MPVCALRVAAAAIRFETLALVLRLFAEPARLRAIPVEPPPYWELKELLKAALAP
jgi:hypothetical protein